MPSRALPEGAAALLRLQQPAHRLPELPCSQALRSTSAATYGARAPRRSEPARAPGRGARPSAGTFTATQQYESTLAILDAGHEPIHTEDRLHVLAPPILPERERHAEEDVPLVVETAA